MGDHAGDTAASLINRSGGSPLEYVSGTAAVLTRVTPTSSFHNDKAANMVGSLVTLTDNGGRAYAKLTPTEPWTVSYWCYQLGTGSRYMLGRMASNVGWYVTHDSGATGITFALKSNASNHWSVGATGLPTLNSRWAHVVIVHDPDAGGTGPENVRVYIDGVQWTTTPVATGTLTAPAYTAQLQVGGVGSAYSTGYLDEVAIWNKALGHREVAEIRPAGRPGELSQLSSASALTVWFRCGDQPGDSASQLVNAVDGVAAPATVGTTFALDDLVQVP
jgi:hypothetical protein